LFDRLNKIDAKKAQSIFNNRQRLIRALQIYAHSHTSIPPMNKRNKEMYESLIILCNDDRKLIYERINKRVDEMMQNG
jgi:tRNA dimethylallyltransferase